MKKFIQYSIIVCLVSWVLALVFHLVTGYDGSLTGDFAIDSQNKIPLMAFSTAYMFFPLICALVLQRINKEKPSSTGLLKFKPNKWWFIGWLITPLIVGLALVVNTLFAEVSLSNPNITPEMTASLPDNISVDLILVITIVSGLFAGITINAIAAFGEEYGWRNYMVNALKGKGFIKSALLIGIVWGFWHFPIILMGHNYPDHRVAGVFLFCITTILLGFVELYFVKKAQSVYPAAIIHGTFNALAGVSLIFTTGGNDLLNGMPGLSGFIALAISCVLIFIYDKYISHDNIITSEL